MEEKIDEALAKMLEMVRASSQPDSALKFSQTALNLVHARAVYSGKTPTTKKN